VSDRQQRRHRKAERREAAQLLRSHADLAEHLREQIGFIKRSAAAFDQGHEEEAKRIAVVLRVLLHDTQQSVSLLGQLRQLRIMSFLDTADPIDPRNMLTTLGLCMVQMTTGGDGPSARYVPYLGDAPRQPRWRPFDEWWMQPVSRAHTGSGNLDVSRRRYVLSLADKEGGAHVDPDMDEFYRAITRDNAMSWQYSTDHNPPKPLDNDPILAMVRQIGYEVLESIRPVTTRLSS